MLLIFFSITGIESAVATSEGTNSTTQPFLLQCRVPEIQPSLSNSSTVHANLTEEEMNHLLAEGSCFLACLSNDKLMIDEVLRK